MQTDSTLPARLQEKNIAAARSLGERKIIRARAESIERLGNFLPAVASLDGGKRGGAAILRVHHVAAEKQHLAWLPAILGSDKFL